VEVVCLLLLFWNPGRSDQQPTESGFHLGQNCDENLQVRHWCVRACGPLFLSVFFFSLSLFSIL